MSKKKIGSLIRCTFDDVVYYGVVVSEPESRDRGFWAAFMLNKGGKIDRVTWTDNMLQCTCDECSKSVLVDEL